MDSSVLLIYVHSVLLFLAEGKTSLSSGCTRDDAATRLQRDVDSIIASGAQTLTIPGGAYHFGRNHFLIENARNLAFLAPSPVKLYFSKGMGVNITNAQDVSLGNWTIDHDNVCGEELQSRFSCKHRAITLHLFNSTRVNVSDVSIRQSSYMVLTAFNGGGGHKFTRLRFEPTLKRQCRDAIHFSDQRIGPTIVDSVIGFTSDDLFNIHTTIMVVLKCETPTSCLIVNPHLSERQCANTVYGSNSAMEMVVPGQDSMSFFSWLTDRFVTTRYGHGPPLSVASIERIADVGLLEEAATLVPELAGHTRLRPVSQTNTTHIWYAWDLWRVEFASNVPEGVGRTAMVQIDTISNSGTVLKNNLFTDTNANLGRFKSSDSVIDGNTFTNAGIHSLELSWLPQFFEGPIILSNVTLTRNTFKGTGQHPIHCGPFCGSEHCLYDKFEKPTRTWTKDGCKQCPDCMQGDTIWTRDIHLNNNSIIPMNQVTLLV